jgi:hypothetical protein
MTEVSSNGWSERARRAADAAREHMREARKRWQGGAPGPNEAGSPPQTRAGRKDERASESRENAPVTGQDDADMRATEEAGETGGGQRADLAYALRLLEEGSKSLEEARSID